MKLPLIITGFIIITLVLVAICVDKYNSRLAKKSNSNNAQKEYKESKIFHNKYYEFVSEHSLAISKIKMINKEYQFFNVDLPIYSHDYDNENFYNEVSCYDYMIYQLQFPNTRNILLGKINAINHNNTLFKEYYSKVSSIKLGDFNVEPERLKVERLLKIEKEMFDSYKIHPVVSFKISVFLRYRNMAGVLVDIKQHSYNEYDVCHAIDLIKDKNGTFYNNRSIWDSICRVERAKVSNRMRFSIYQRDNYRCQMCGRRLETDYLEIDHIYPISKGGKTVYENLQTLCRTCNKNKGNKVI